jgi:hypothetical protein
MTVISDYASLKTAIADFLARDDLTEQVEYFIQNTENKLYRSINLRNEETALSVSISSGVAAVPADFKALKFAYYDRTPAALLEWVSITELYNDYPNRSNSAIPCVISREATNFVFGPVSQDGTLKGVYYAKQDPLETTDNSWYVDNAPDALVYGSMAEAALFTKDLEMYNFWQPQFLESVRTIKDEQRQAETSRGSIRVRAS